MLTLDEAITRFTALSKANRSRAESYNRGEDYELIKAKECETCADECDQVASWLTELQERRKAENTGDLISRSALKEAFKGWKGMDDYYHNTDCVDIPFSEAYDLIDNAQTVDLWQMRQETTENGLKKAEALYARPRGEWKPDNLGFTCNKCKWTATVSKDVIGEYHFCPNCGADMKGGEDK